MAAPPGSAPTGGGTNHFNPNHRQRSTRSTSLGATGRDRAVWTKPVRRHRRIQITGHLFISPPTVEWYLSKIFAKLGVPSVTS
ncbi:LuxR C-terminal-related transcriptional regulator [Mycobacterium sp. NPDC003449]